MLHCVLHHHLLVQLLRHPAPVLMLFLQLLTAPGWYLTPGGFDGCIVALMCIYALSGMCWQN